MKKKNSSTEVIPPNLRIYCDGAGCRPDGTGSGYAWFCEQAGIAETRTCSGLTNNEAEYRAILAALSGLPTGQQAQVCSDSQVVIFQLRGEYAVNEPRLQDLHAEIRQLIQEHNLRLTFVWVPRAQNPAGKLLDKAMRGLRNQGTIEKSVQEVVEEP